jgi:hypothetical protein
LEGVFAGQEFFQSHYVSCDDKRTLPLADAGSESPTVVVPICPEEALSWNKFLLAVMLRF